jgi:hypothetical protein
VGRRDPGVTSEQAPEEGRIFVAGGAATWSLGQGGDGLGTMWGWEIAMEMLRTAGFEAPLRSTFDHDPLNVWFVSRKA